MSPGDQSVIGPGTVAAAGLRSVELARESRTRGGRVEDERGGGGRRQGRRPAVNKRVGNRRRRHDYAVADSRNVAGAVGGVRSIVQVALAGLGSATPPELESTMKV